MSFKFIYLPLILIFPYVYSIKNFFTKKNKIFYFFIFISIFLWSFLSGYGRYMTSMIFMIWLLILYDFRDQFNFIKKISFNRNFLLFLLIFILFSNIRLDYGMRNFIFEKFIPPKIISYNIKLFLNGLNFILKDRYKDIYLSLKDRSYKEKIEAVVIVNRGVSSFYASLISMNNNTPVYEYIDYKKAKGLINNQNVSKKIKSSLKNYLNKSKILVLSTKDYSIDFIYQTDFIKRGYKCQINSNNKLVPQFQHENYFNYVVEYYCSKD